MNKTADPELWLPTLWCAVYRIVYGAQPMSNFGPFPRDQCSPKVKPASWLYYQLFDDAELRAKVLK